MNRLRIAFISPLRNIRIDQLTAYKYSEGNRVRVKDRIVIRSSYLPLLLAHRAKGALL
jgi:hypothetical protein